MKEYDPSTGGYRDNKTGDHFFNREDSVPTYLSESRTKKTSDQKSLEGLVSLGGALFFGILAIATAVTTKNPSKSNSASDSKTSHSANEKSNTDSTILAEASFPRLKVECPVPLPTPNACVITMAKAYANLNENDSDFYTLRIQSIKIKKTEDVNYKPEKRLVSLSDCKKSYDCLVALEMAEDCNVSYTELRNSGKSRIELIDQEKLSAIKSFNWKEFCKQGILEAAEAKDGNGIVVTNLLTDIMNKSLHINEDQGTLSDFLESLGKLSKYGWFLRYTYNRSAFRSILWLSQTDKE